MWLEVRELNAVEKFNLSNKMDGQIRGVWSLRSKEQKGNAVVTYKKSQVLYALWHTLRNPAVKEDKPSSTLSNRLDKLQSVYVPLSKEERGGQAGIDNECTAAQAFLTGTALSLMDAGFGLGTAGFFIHHARDSLLLQYDRIMQNRPSWRNQKEAKDKTVWLLLQNHDLQELYPAYDRSKIEGWTGSGLPPLIINPKYAYGRDAMHQELDGYINHSTHRHLLVVELAKMASVLTHYLETAPVLKRGRHR